MIPSTDCLCVVTHNFNFYLWKYRLLRRDSLQLLLLLQLITALHRILMKASNLWKFINNSFITYKIRQYLLLLHTCVSKVIVTSFLIHGMLIITARQLLNALEVIAMLVVYNLRAETLRSRLGQRVRLLLLVGILIL